MYKNKLKIINFIVISAFVVACGSGHSGNLSGSITPEPIINDVTPKISLDQISVIPVSDNPNLSYILRVNNFTSEVYGLVSVKVTDINGKKDRSNLLKVSAPVGASIPAKASVVLNLIPKANKSADVLLTVQVKKNGGKEETLQQIIRMSNSINSTSGIASYNDLGTVITADNNYGLAVPFILTNDFTNVKSINGEVSCQGHQFIKGNSCTLLVKGKLLSTSRYVSTDLIGYAGAKEVARSSGGSLVKFGQEGNLLISHGVTIQKADGVQSVDLVLYNNGTASAQLGNIQALLGNNSKLIINKGTCTTTTTIATNSSCVMTISAKSDTSGLEGVSVPYQSGLINKNLSSTVLYRGVVENVNLSYFITGSLLNTIVGDEKSVQILLKNDGKKPFNQLMVNLPVGLRKEFSINNSTCSSGIAPGENCTFNLKYKPSAVVNQDILNLNIQAEYANNYILYHVPIDYSAIKSTSALSMELEDGSGTDFVLLADNQNAKRQNNFVIKNQATSIQLGAELGNFQQSSFNAIAGSLLPKDFDRWIHVDNTLATANGISGCERNHHKLQAGAACRFGVSYAGDIPVHPLAQATLAIPFVISGQEDNVVSPVLNFEVINGPLIDLEQTDIKVYSSGGTDNKLLLPNLSPFTLDANATGFSNSPFNFISNSQNAFFVVTYKFKNISSSIAKGFNVANLHYLGEVIMTPLAIDGGGIVPATNCPFGERSADLVGNGECNITLKLPRQEILQGNITDNTVNQFLADKIDVVPELSYSDASTNSIRVHRSERFNRYFDYSRSWVNLDVTPDTLDAQFDTKENVWRIEFTVTARNFPLTNSTNPINSAQVNLKVQPNSNVNLSDLFQGSSIPLACNLSINSNCTFKLRLSPEKFAIGVNVPIFFEITNPSATLIEVKRSFGLANWSN